MMSSHHIQTDTSGEEIHAAVVVLIHETESNGFWKEFVHYHNNKTIREAIEKSIDILICKDDSGNIVNAEELEVHSVFYARTAILSASSERLKYLVSKIPPLLQPGPS
jgi:pyruvoyl-dependent arginine decarboxylase (PvlArgDC)